MARSGIIGVLLGIAAFGLFGLVVSGCHRAQTPAPTLGRWDTPAPLAVWPWPNAVKETLRKGVTHWQDTSSPDGTILDFFAFDFATNPRLRLELFDQDEDDDAPFDNNVKFWPRGVGQITKQLNATGRGKVIAACNGLFFDLDHTGMSGTAHHVTPVILRGKSYANVVNHRWTFGVQYQKGRPVFKTLHMPEWTTLSKEFDFGAGAAQCLIREGVPLQLEPFPAVNAILKTAPVPSTQQEAGHIPSIDFIRTSRVSLGWSQDNRWLYLLFVKSPKSEFESSVAFLRRQPENKGVGWMLADLQRFWVAKQVWGAINSDGGVVAQLTYLRSDGDYELIPPLWSHAGYVRLAVSPAFDNAPPGGSLLYFYVREADTP